MYNYKIKFTKKSGDNSITAKEIFDMVDNYYSALYNNGQVVGGFEFYADCDSLFFTIVLPRPDSLFDDNNNEYVRDCLKKLQNIFNIEIIKEGDNLEYHKSCTCEKHSWFFLYNENTNGESPLVCGDCHKPVPLYEVPYINNENSHYSVLGWRRAKNAMDTLWYHGLWDRFTYGEIVRHNSKLNREGRKICCELEKALGVPVYYYIYYFCEDYDDECMITPKGLPYEIPKACPKCNGEWIDDSEFCKCEKCRIILDSPQWQKAKDEYSIALELAQKAHEGQMDKSGKEYILHPLAVSEYCSTECAKIAAVLHDVVEDTDVTLEDLRAAEISEDVIAAVDCVTKREGESLEDYFVRVGGNDIAVEVKFADMRHNSDISRWPENMKHVAVKNAYKYWLRMEKLYNMVGKERAEKILAPELLAHIIDCILESYQ